jgi:hypothetical protein
MFSPVFRMPDGTFIWQLPLLSTMNFSFSSGFSGMSASVNGIWTALRTLRPFLSLTMAVGSAPTTAVARKTTRN